MFPHGVFTNTIILLFNNNFEITIGSSIVLNIFCFIFAYTFRYILGISIKKYETLTNYKMFYIMIHSFEILIYKLIFAHWFRS